MLGLAEGRKEETFNISVFVKVGVVLLGIGATREGNIDASVLTSLLRCAG
jgi:hypothetical protein